MGVVKRGNSKFWYIQFQVNGKTHIKSSKTTDRKIAEIMEADWRKQLIVHDLVGFKSRAEINEILNGYAESKSHLVNHGHVVRYCNTIRDSFKSLRYIDELTTLAAENFKNDLLRRGYANQTVKHVIGAFRGAWRYAKRMGYQVSDLEFPTVPVHKGKLRYLAFEEEQRLLQALDPRRDVKGLPSYEQRNLLLQQEMQDKYDFVVTLLDTGARYSEIATLEVNRVNLQERTISLWRPKVKNESIIYMTDRVYEILERRLKNATGKYVYSNRSGGARGYTSISLRKAFVQAGLKDCSPHTLRHTLASRLIQNGLNLYEVKEILGHADIKTTMRYAHIEQRSVSRKAKDVIDRLNKENSPTCRDS